MRKTPQKGFENESFGYSCAKVAEIESRLPVSLKGFSGESFSSVLESCLSRFRIPLLHLAAHR